VREVADHVDRVHLTNLIDALDITEGTTSDFSWTFEKT